MGGVGSQTNEVHNLLSSAVSVSYTEGVAFSINFTKIHTAEHVIFTTLLHQTNLQQLSINRT